MHKDRCPICFEHYVEGFVIENLGSKYYCGQCGRFGFNQQTDHFVTTYLLNREDARKALQAYIKDHQTEGLYLMLRLDKIENVLKQAGVNVESLFPPEQRRLR
jgi:hypothetical protein